MGEEVLTFLESPSELCTMLCCFCTTRTAAGVCAFDLLEAGLLYVLRVVVGQTDRL